MIYLDASVVIAQVYGEDRRPPESMWSKTLVSSRLLEYEVWTRIHSRKIADSHGELARSLLGRVAFLEMIGEVVGRAREAYPLPVRALDGLHLASVDFLVSQGQHVELATYDGRMADVAQKMGIPIYSPD